MKNRKNILLIAYAFPPNKRVGAMRAGYWYENLPKQYNYSVSVITNEKEAKGEKVHFVECKGSSLLSKLVADPGVVWKENIKSYLDNNEVEKPDVAIITGGPFMHFALSPWLKKKYNCKVVLDYRDPFATNPAFRNSKLKVLIKSFFERRFNRNADALVTVNKYCSEIISNFHSKPNAIVGNGYDENVLGDSFASNLNQASLSFVYPGKLYFPFTPIEEAINNTNCSLVYMGGQGEELNTVKSKKDLGFVGYETVVKEISKADIGIIQTIGSGVESTTKIYDFVKCGKPILIVSKNKIHEGSIEEELKDYPNVYWSKNNTYEITKVISEIRASEFIHPPQEIIEKFSRKEQTKPLVKLIEQLTND